MLSIFSFSSFLFIFQILVGRLLEGIELIWFLLSIIFQLNSFILLSKAPQLQVNDFVKYLYVNKGVAILTSFQS